MKYRIKTLLYCCYILALATLGSLIGIKRKFHYFIAVGGIIHLFARFDLITGAELPCDYTWGQRYILRIEYLKRRSKGIDCTFDDVEKEYLDDWNRKFQEALKRLKEERAIHENWWT